MDMSGKIHAPAAFPTVEQEDKWALNSF